MVAIRYPISFVGCGDMWGGVGFGVVVNPITNRIRPHFLVDRTTAPEKRLFYYNIMYSYYRTPSTLNSYRNRATNDKRRRQQSTTTPLFVVDVVVVAP